MHAPAAGDDQRVQGKARLGERLGREPKPGGGHGERPIRHHHRLIRAGATGSARQIVGGGEDLERAGNVEELHIPEGQDLDPAWLWRKTRGLWHFRQILIV